MRKRLLAYRWHKECPLVSLLDLDISYALALFQNCNFGDFDEVLAWQNTNWQRRQSRATRRPDHSGRLDHTYSYASITPPYDQYIST